MIAYRICEKKDDKILTLFHALDGSRVLPLNTWLKAQIKPVRDGSRLRAKEYISGFHVLKTEEACRNFMKNRFKAPRELVIVECEVGELRKKEHSPFNVFLADEIKLLRILN